MKYLVVFIAVLSLALSSCSKEDIFPHKSGERNEDCYNSKNVNTNNNSSDDNTNNEDDSITDPNKDEDESKKVKKGK